MSSQGAPPPSVDPASVNPPPADVSPPPPPPPAEPQAVAAAAVVGLPAPPPPPRKVARKSAPAAEKSVLEMMDERVLIGVAAGAGLLVLFMIGLICCACRNCKKKNKKKKYAHGDQDQVQYYYVNGTQYSPSPQPNKNWNPDQALHIPIAHNSDTISSNLSSPLQLPTPVGLGPGLCPQQLPTPVGLGPGFNHGTFTYDELAAATSGFLKANLLGQGGFGYVHKGVLPNGREIAVKSLKAGSGQGEREFQAEVEIISRVHHRHLVSLVGYCIAGGKRMLVYEYVPNNNLEFHLHGKGRAPLEWATRLKIAKGSARGLAYLHEGQPRIIHRDIKTANILVDYNFDAQVADFGLAKLTSENQTHVSTRIMGTFGYLAPEYACSGQLTEKSDVYSFGIMLLELITGRPPVDFTGEMEETLVDWARPLLLRALDDGNYDEFIDPRLQNNFDPYEMRRMIACAAASVRHSARKRPKMSKIVRALEGDVSLDDLHNGVKPGQSTTFDKDMTEMRKFMKLALDTTDDSA